MSMAKSKASRNLLNQLAYVGKEAAKQSFIEPYSENINQLVTDAKEVTTAITDGKTKITDVVADIKKNGGKKIADWFFQRGDDTDDADLTLDNDSDFDAGFQIGDKGDDDEGPPSKVLDATEMKDIARGQVNAMYKIAGKQAEASMINAGEITMAINGRAGDIVTAINNSNKTLISINEKLDALLKLQGAIAQAEEEARQEAALSLTDSSGKVTLGSFLNNAKGNIGSALGDAKFYADMAGQMSPAMMLSMFALDPLKQKKIDAFGGLSIDDIGNEINHSIGNIISDTLSSVPDMIGKAFKPGSMVGGFLKKLFKDNQNGDSNFGKFTSEDQSTYNKDKATFDGMTRQTIVEIIPGYLKTIATALTGQELHINNKGHLSAKVEDHREGIDMSSFQGSAFKKADNDLAASIINNATLGAGSNVNESEFEQAKKDAIAHQAEFGEIVTATMVMLFLQRGYSDVKPDDIKDAGIWNAVRDELRDQEGLINGLSGQRYMLAMFAYVGGVQNSLIHAKKGMFGNNNAISDFAHSITARMKGASTAYKNHQATLNQRGIDGSKSDFDIDFLLGKIGEKNNSAEQRERNELAQEKEKQRQTIIAKLKEDELAYKAKEKTGKLDEEIAELIKQEERSKLTRGEKTFEQKERELDQKYSKGGIENVSAFAKSNESSIVKFHNAILDRLDIMIRLWDGTPPNDRQTPTTIGTGFNDNGSDNRSNARLVLNAYPAGTNPPPAAPPSTVGPSSNGSTSGSNDGSSDGGSTSSSSETNPKGPNEEDKALANVIQSQINAAGADGDTASDVGWLRQQINKIKDMGLKKTLETGLQKLSTGAKNVGGKIADGAKSVGKGLFGLLGGAAGKLGIGQGPIGTVAKTIGSAVGNVVGKWFKFLKDQFVSGFGKVKEGFTTLFKKKELTPEEKDNMDTNQVIKAMPEKIVGGFTSIVEELRKLGNDVKTEFNKTQEEREKEREELQKQQDQPSSSTNNDDESEDSDLDESSDTHDSVSRKNRRKRAKKKKFNNYIDHLKNETWIGQTAKNVGTAVKNGAEAAAGFTGKAIGNTVKLVQGGVKLAGDAVNTVKTGIKNGATNVVSMFTGGDKEKAAGILGGITEKLGAIGKIGIGLAQMVMSVVMGFGSVKAFMKLIQSTLKNGLSALQKPVSKIIKVLTPIVKKIGTLLKKVAQAVAKVVASLDKLYKTLAQTIMKVFDKIIEMLDPLMEAVFSIVDVLMAVLEPILDLLSSILEPILDLLTNVLDLVGTLVSELVKPLCDLLMPIIKPILWAVTKVLQVVTKIVSGIVKIITIVTKFLCKPLKWITDKINWFVEKVSAAWKWLKGWLDIAWRGLKLFGQVISGVAKILGGWLKGFFKKVGEGIKKVFSTLGNLLKNAIIGAIKFVATYIPPYSIITFTLKSIAKGISLVGKVVKKIFDVVESLNVVKKAKEWASDKVNKVKEGFGKAVDVGKRMLGAEGQELVNKKLDQGEKDVKVVFGSGDAPPPESDNTSTRNNTNGQPDYIKKLSADLYQNLNMFIGETLPIFRVIGKVVKNYVTFVKTVLTPFFTLAKTYFTIAKSAFKVITAPIRLVSKALDGILTFMSGGWFKKPQPAEGEMDNDKVRNTSGSGDTINLIKGMSIPDSLKDTAKVFAIGTYTALSEVLKEVRNDLKIENLKVLVPLFAENAKILLDTFMSRLPDILKPVCEIVSDALGLIDIFETIADMADTVSLITTAIHETLDIITSILEATKQAIIDCGITVVEGIVDMITGFFHRKKEKKEDNNRNEAIQVGQLFTSSTGNYGSSIANPSSPFSQNKFEQNTAGSYNENIVNNGASSLITSNIQNDASAFGRGIKGPYGILLKILSPMGSALMNLLNIFAKIILPNLGILINDLGMPMLKNFVKFYDDFTTYNMMINLPSMSSVRNNIVPNIKSVIAMLKMVLGAMQSAVGQVIAGQAMILIALNQPAMGEALFKTAAGLSAAGLVITAEGVTAQANNISRQIDNSITPISKLYEDASDQGPVNGVTDPNADPTSADNPSTVDDPTSADNPSGGGTPSGGGEPSTVDIPSNPTNPSGTGYNPQTNPTNPGGGSTINPVNPTSNPNSIPTPQPVSQGGGGWHTMFDITGSGDSQGSYGGYLNMSQRGCGPIALADAFARRGGGRIGARALAGGMASAGNYSSARGTSVGGFLSTAASMGMGYTVGGVSQGSLRNASPNNPVTLVGSGGGFGTRNGNTHYVNVIGTDGSGGAYVSNPLTGRVERRSTNDLVAGSIMGLYGSGDVLDLYSIYGGAGNSPNKDTYTSSKLRTVTTQDMKIIYDRHLGSEEKKLFDDAWSLYAQSSPNAAAAFSGNKFAWGASTLGHAWYPLVTVNIRSDVKRMANDIISKYSKSSTTTKMSDEKFGQWLYSQAGESLQAVIDKAWTIWSSNNSAAATSIKGNKYVWLANQLRKYGISESSSESQIKTAIRKLGEDISRQYPVDSSSSDTTTTTADTGSSYTGGVSAGGTGGIAGISGLASNYQVTDVSGYPPKYVAANVDVSALKKEDKGSAIEQFQEAMNPLRNLFSNILNMFSTTKEKKITDIMKEEANKESEENLREALGNEAYEQYEPMAFELYKQEHPKNANESEEGYQRRLKSGWTKAKKNEYMKRVAGGDAKMVNALKYNSQVDVMNGVSSTIWGDYDESGQWTNSMLGGVNYAGVATTTGGIGSTLIGGATGNVYAGGTSSYATGSGTAAGGGVMASEGGAIMWTDGYNQEITDVNVVENGGVSQTMTPVHEFFAKTAGAGGGQVDYAFSNNGNWYIRRDNPNKVGEGSSGESHKGVDIKTSPKSTMVAGKSELHAITGGKVIDVRYAGKANKASPYNQTGDGGWGNSVEFQDSAGYYHRYAHMRDNPTVNVGDTVAPGQLLGVIGTTGQSTGEHLHYQLEDPSHVHKNPMTYFVYHPPAAGSGYSGATQGAVKHEGITGQHDSWASYAKKYSSTIPSFISSGFSAGMTPAEIATIMSMGIWEDGGRKIFGNKSLTGTTYDTKGQRADGIMNWVETGSKGATIPDQLKYIKDRYFSSTPMDGYKSSGTYRQAIADRGGSSVFQQMTGRGTGYTLNVGDRYYQKLNSDLTEGSSYYYQGDLAPDKAFTADGLADYVGTAIGAYNWMLNNGYGGSSYSSDKSGKGGVDLEQNSDSDYWAGQVWNFLKNEGFSDAGAAGVMGNFYRESLMIPYLAEGKGYSPPYQGSWDYTLKADAGGSFVGDSVGYGLAQWTNSSRKQTLLNNAKSTGSSVGSLTAQFATLREELAGSEKAAASVKNDTDPVTAARNWQKLFERAGVVAQEDRDNAAKKYFEQYSGTMGTAAGTTTGGTLGSYTGGSSFAYGGQYADIDPKTAVLWSPSQYGYTGLVDRSGGFANYAFKGLGGYLNRMHVDTSMSQASLSGVGSAGGGGSAYGTPTGGGYAGSWIDALATAIIATDDAGLHTYEQVEHTITVDGKTLHGRPDCTGMFKYGLDLMGYDVDNIQSGMLERAADKSQHPIKKNGQESPDWTAYSFSPEAVQPGDIIVHDGHGEVGMGMSGNTLYGWNFGDTPPILRTQKAAREYKQGKSALQSAIDNNITMGKNHKYIIRYTGGTSTVNGTAEGVDANGTTINQAIANGELNLTAAGDIEDTLSAYDIPPIDHSKFLNYVNSSKVTKQQRNNNTAMDFGGFEAPVVNNTTYSIQAAPKTDDEMIEKLMKNTYNVKAEKVEKLLEQVIVKMDELMDKKDQKPTPTNNPFVNLFPNNEIPKQIESLAKG